jgi:hypothetical protein
MPGASPDRGVAQLPQNANDGGLLKPQDPQMRGSEVPQAPQNRMPAGLAVLHCGQFWVAGAMNSPLSDGEFLSLTLPTKSLTTCGANVSGC